MRYLHNGRVDWAHYWRSPDRPLEAMHAHFEGQAFHLHSHETYSFGVTESGAQAFRCRGEARTSNAGLVMAFNPDEPHDGHATSEHGFTYRIVHIGPELVADLLRDKVGRSAGLPLFDRPVLHDPLLARALHRVYANLHEPANMLGIDEALAAAVAAMVRRGARSAPQSSSARQLGHGAQQLAAQRAAALLEEGFADEVSADELALTAGCSRFTLYRAFQAHYGMAPSDYQRQLRLRAARRLLVAGRSAADAAVDAGFADQAHLTRWFRRCYGITPGTYQQAG